jgi:hypothetical protein
VVIPGGPPPKINGRECRGIACSANSIEQLISPVAWKNSRGLSKRLKAGHLPGCPALSEVDRGFGLAALLLRVSAGVQLVLAATQVASVFAAIVVTVPGASAAFAASAARASAPLAASAHHPHFVLLAAGVLCLVAAAIYPGPAAASPATFLVAVGISCPA